MTSQARPALVSVLMPVYNEEEFVFTAIERALSAPLPEGLDRELIVVDDGSTDGSWGEIQRALARWPDRVRALRHTRNRGKGAAIRTALAWAKGQYTLIQDADLEYDPADYPKLLRPLLAGKADAVYGSRFLVAGERRVLYFWHALANRLITTLCNIAADCNLSDVETCYKAVRTSLLKSIPLRSNRFGIEPELTIKLAKRQARIYEVPVNYHGRTYEEGKKVTAWDALLAPLTILRYWLTRDIYKDRPSAILDALAAGRRFHQWMASLLRPHLGARVLEIGAGIGNLAWHLSRQRQLYIATDIDPEHLARLQARLHHRVHVEVHRLDINSASDYAPFAGRVDSLVCANVLEHVKDDEAALRNFYQILPPGGRVVVLVPQGPRLYGSLDRELGHFRRYRQQELLDKLQRAGFQVEHVSQFNRISTPGWFVAGRLLRRRQLSRTAIRLFDLLVPCWRALERWLPWPGASLVVVGRKPLEQGGQTK